MAGDWIKMQKSTPDKPEVWAIAEALEIDPDAVVGKLFRVWSWFDEQSQDGHAPSVTTKLLDRDVGVPGFCEAMQSAGWMVDDGETISIPNFDRYNGESAKKRALAAERKRKQRDGSVTPVPNLSRSERDACVTREEKRREEEKIGTTAPRKRGCRIPDDFPSADEIEWANENHPTVDPKKETPKFRDYWSGVSGQKGVKLDWPATWRNWIRRTAENQPKTAERDGPLGQVLE